MADGMGIQGVASAATGVAASTASQAAEAASRLPAQPAADRAAEATQRAQQATSFSSTAAPAAPSAHSRVVQRLLEQNATIYGPGLARLPLPARPDGVPRAMPKKPAGPMSPPRELDGGRSPLAPLGLADARHSVDAIGTAPEDSGESNVLDAASDGAFRLPSRHGLVAYTATGRGDSVYLTHERWLHIRANHMDATPQPRGKRTTTWWPTRHAVNAPSMTEQDVIGVIVDAARKGILRTEVRDTRMAEYDLPSDQAASFGVSEAKVSMAPDGLVLSAYPGAGDNVLAVYEMTEDDQAALAAAQATSFAAEVEAGEGDDRMFRTNVASTTFG